VSAREKLHRLQLFLREIVGWAMISVITGVFGGLLVVILTFALQWCSQQWARVPLWALWALPAAGGGLVGLIFWRIGREAEGEPIPKYIQAVNRKSGVIPFAQGAMALLGSFVTLGTGGSGGITGPTVLSSSYLSSALASRMGSLLKFFNMKQEARSRFAVCAAAAAISAILRAPIGGGIMAVELLFRKDLDYQKLFAAMLSSVSGYLVFGAVTGDFDPLFARPGSEVPSVDVLPAVALLVIAVVLMSLGFVWLYEKTYKFASRSKLPAPVRLALGGLFVGLVALGLYALGGPDGLKVMGTSRKYMLDVVAKPGHSVGLWFLAVFLLAKLAATCVTVGSGNVAGFVMPTLLLGGFAGHIGASLCGWRTADYSTQHAAMLCAGIAAAMAATLNCPLSAALLGLELFGLRFAWVSAGAALVAYKLTQDRAVYTLSLGAPRVMVVDDDANLRRVIVKLFTHHGYEVAEAGDGLEAQELLSRPGGRPDLLVLDRQMPRMSGEELLERLRADTAMAGLPVIMLTARSTSEDVVEGLQAGADDYIAKPFHHEELIARADRLIKRTRSGEGAMIQ
jgi:chloride channel protein, CIC family